ncbi:MAG: DUF4139 domain-containing protein [Bacteroidota bacterium]
MSKIKLLVIACLLPISVLAQDQKKVDSRISEITVFLNKAQVTRKISTRINGGNTDIILQKLATNIDEQSIQVKGTGSFTILGIKFNRNYLSNSDTPKEIKLLKDSLSYYQNEVIKARNLKDVYGKEEQMVISNQVIGGKDKNITAAELKAMADFFRQRLQDLGNKKIAIDQKVKKYSQRIVAIQRQLNDQNALNKKNTGEIVITLAANAAATAKLDVQYVVGNAGWYPVYDLRAKNTSSPLELNYKANVYQNTDVEWKDVKLKLSTANPNLGGNKPELYAWYLDIYRPVVSRSSGFRSDRSDELRKFADNDFDEVEEVDFFVEDDQSSSSLAESTVTVQTTLNTEFAISIPYSVTSGGKATTVDVKQYDMKADFNYSAVPKLDDDAFLLARIAEWEELNLLPGDMNVFFEGTFVAKSYLDPNNTGDTLDISLGRDKRVVIERKKKQDFTSKKFIGGNRKETYAYEISVRNTKKESLSIKLEDQIPVSQNSEIEVSLVDSKGAKVENYNGKLTWNLDVGPSETKEVVFIFEIKYPKNKRISGL